MAIDLGKSRREGSPQDWEALVRLSEDLLGVVSFDGRVELCNPAWESRFGAPRGQPEPADFLATVHPGDRDRMQIALLKIARGEVVPPVEVRGLRREGGECRISWRLAASAGRWRCAVAGRDVASSRDISADPLGDRRLTELGLVAALVAHDFNNVLTIIRGCASMLEINPGVTPAQRIELEDLSGAVRHGSELVQQVLAYSRKQAAPTGAADLNKVVAEMNWMLRRLGRESIGVELVLSRDLGLAKAEEVQVEQVLFNLALNACDAMPGGGRLSIETADVLSDAACAPPLPPLASGYVRLVVSDTGEGIAPEVLARLFEPFFTTKRNGTGLGLFSVRRIVQQCGGQLSIRSLPRQGTSFEAYFPRTDAPPSRAPL
jgi:signal transduction histidine kinase